MTSEDVSATPTDTGVSPPVSDPSLKKKRIREYAFHCPCDQCEGQPPIPYKTVRNHLKRLKDKISRTVGSNTVNEENMARLLTFNDKMNEFNLAVKNGTWRGLAIDRDSQLQQSHVVVQPAEVQEESIVDMNCDYGGGLDELDNAYESEEADGNLSAEDDGSETEGERDHEIEEQQSNELNEIVIESESRVSLQDCTLPEDLALWLLDPVERYPAGQMDQKLVGDFCVELLLNMLENKYAMQNIKQDFNIISRYFSNAPSYNKVEALLRKIGSPFHTFYTCVNHHPVTSDKGSTCSARSCRKEMSIPIKQLKIMEILRRAMQDTTFAQGVRYGPSLPRQGSDQVLSSVWQSPAMERLKLEKGIDMEMTDEYIPIVVELFTDGFSPFNRSVYSIWCVLIRILNLPQKKHACCIYGFEIVY